MCRNLVGAKVLGLLLMLSAVPYAAFSSNGSLSEVSASTQDGTQTITGVVQDQNGAPLIGVSVSVSGTTTDEEGAFHFDIRKPVDLYISAVGFRDTIIQCHPSQPQELILQKKDYALAEVIVTPNTHMPMLIGYPDAEPMEGWRACIPASGDGIFYTPQKKEIGAFLSSMQMYIYPMGKPQTPMAIRLMAPKHSHFKRNQVIPTTDFVDLLPEPLLLKAEQPGWQRLWRNGRLEHPWLSPLPFCTCIAV